MIEVFKYMSMFSRDGTSIIIVHFPLKHFCMLINTLKSQGFLQGRVHRAALLWMAQHRYKVLLTLSRSSPWAQQDMSGSCHCLCAPMHKPIGLDEQDFQQSHSYLERLFRSSYVILNQLLSEHMEPLILVQGTFVKDNTMKHKRHFTSSRKNKRIPLPIEF